MSTVTSLPAPTWLRDLTAARADYAETLGWPVSINITRRDLVLIADGAVGAISMPARLGARVRQELAIALLPGPIIADPAGTYWTFLTHPAGTLRLDITHHLAAVRVHLATRGTRVGLPDTRDTTAPTARRWVERPVPNRALPPGSAVVAVIRRLTYDGGHLAA